MDDRKQTHKKTLTGNTKELQALNKKMSPREKTLAGIRHLLLSGAALGMSVCQTGCDTTDVCQTDCVAVDPAPPPFECSRDLQYRSSDFLRWDAIWRSYPAGMVAQTRIYLTGFGEAKISFNGDPIVRNGRFPQVHPSGDNRTIAILALAEEDATTQQIEIPMLCNNEDATVYLTLHLDENPTEGQSIPITN